MKSIYYLSSTINLLASCIFGGIIGTMTSLLVNCTLLEISMNKVFSIYFGILFILVGSFIFWKALVNNESNKGDVIFTNRHPNIPKQNTKKICYIILSILVTLSGFTSFLLDQNWFLFINYIYKIPIYSLLGVSICFTLSFMVIEIINYFSNCFVTEHSLPLIRMTNQYTFILIISCLLGIIYGLIFSIMDLEDLSENVLKAAFVREQNFCIPIGFGFGFITGYVSEYMRNEYCTSDYQQIFIREEEI